MATQHGRSTLTSLPNFRDVGQSINHFSATNILRPGLLYRSARPDEATPTDRQLLITEYKIKTIIDLRTPTEHIEQARKHASTSLPSKPAKTSKDPLPRGPRGPHGRISGIEYIDVNLNGSHYSNALIKQLPYHQAAKLIFYYSVGWRKDAIAILATNVMAARGLAGLAIDSLVHSKTEVKSIFTILCDKEKYPMLLHCTQGKDRTGLVALLVLMLCEVDAEAVGKDYRLSQRELEGERAEKVAELRSIGLPEAFADCPAEWTGTVWKYVDEELGGVEMYLESCGVSREQQGTLRKLLCAA